MLAESPLTPEAAPALQDGRRNRTVETRKRIAAAFTELIREGHVAPTAEEVSVRASVGLRTVFRHFDDMETLYREVNVELQSIIQSMIQMKYTSEGWQDRLLEGIGMRARLYESITPFLLAAKVHRHESVVIDEFIREGVGLERSLLKRIVPQELQSEKHRFEALVMVLSPESWVRLRREQGLSVAAAIASLRMLVNGLVATWSKQ
jgi:AcrR family transcriptional regulator